MYSLNVLKLIIISMCAFTVICGETDTDQEIVENNEKNIEILSEKLMETENIISINEKTNITENTTKALFENPIETSPTITTSTTTTTTSTTTTTTESPTTPTTSTTVSKIETTVTTNTIQNIFINKTDYPLRECLRIGLNTKITLKYKSSDDYDQEIELTGGDINGEVIQNNRCDERQKIVIKYKQIDKSQLILWLHRNGTHIHLDEIIFEYPIEKLPEDYIKPVDPEYCTSDIIGFNFAPNDRCMIASNRNNSFLMHYQINQQIKCSEIPVFKLETNFAHEFMDVFLYDFQLFVYNNENDIPLEKIDGNCTYIYGNSSLIDSHVSDAGHTKVWLGVTTALVGAIFIFGVIFLYEKVLRKKFIYSQVKKPNDPEI